MLSVQAFRPFSLQLCALLACCNLAFSCSLHCFQLVDILLVYACQINFKARMPTPLLDSARSMLPAPVVALLNSELPCPVH